MQRWLHDFPADQYKVGGPDQGKFFSVVFSGAGGLGARRAKKANLSDEKKGKNSTDKHRDEEPNQYIQTPSSMSDEEESSLEDGAILSEQHSTQLKGSTMWLFVERYNEA